MTWWWVLAMAVQARPVGGCGAELADLDRTRALAFAAADPDALREVYAAGSPLLAADARTVEQYRDRGARVRGATLGMSSCREVDRSADTVRLDVVDTLGPATVVWQDGSSTRLPTDRPTRRVVTLRLTDDGWRIESSTP